MKNKFLVVSMVAAMLVFTACSEKKETVTEEAVTEVVDTIAPPPADVAETAPDSAAVTTEETKPAPQADITVTGTVTEIINGKDGYTAKIKTAEGKIYPATISIPNMEKGFKRVKIGDKVSITGEPIQIEEDVLIKAKSFN